jgi:NodT family efflux transporter outer membrane factor (OMF) lipoprotein
MMSNTSITREQASLTATTATAAVAAALLLLSACAVGPEFKHPAVQSSQHYDREAEHQLTQTAGSTSSPHVSLDKKVEGDWWSTFRSPKLDRVMRQAIDGNLDLVAADATIARATEAVAAAAGGRYPQLDFGAAIARQRVAGPPQALTGSSYAIGPQVSFDLDLFGGTRRLVEQQSALEELQQHRFDAAYLTLTGDVASQAVLLASARAQIDAVQVLLTDDRKNLDLIRFAHRNGSATQVDVALAENQLSQDETLLPPLAQQRDTARHALSLLVSKGPADWVAPDFDLADFTLPLDLPVSLPSEVAHDRPDILAAEAQLHAESAAIGVATANLYPHLELSASLTEAATNPGFGTLWGVAAGLTAPLFHGGTLKAQRRAAVDDYQASLARYQQTVIKSFVQVADVLQAINHDAEEYSAQERALNAAAVSLRLSRDGYRAGELGVLQVLDAERAYQQALLGQIRAKTAQYLDTTQLSVALGGNSSGASERRAARREGREGSG